MTSFAKTTVGLVLVGFFAAGVNAADPKQNKPSHRLPGNGPVTKLPIKPADLAAVEIGASVTNLFEDTPAKSVTVGYVKNVGGMAFNGSRLVKLEAKIWGPNGTQWVTVASATCKTLAPGKYFQVSVEELEKKYLFIQQLRLTVAAGDNNPANDIHYQQPKPAEIPR
jgi:hypothetical protein